MFLYVLSCIRWIQPIRLTQRVLIHITHQTQLKTLFYLQQYPYADILGVSEYFDISRSYAKQRFHSLYKVFDVNGKSQPRLRLYSKLGWYHPYKFEG